MGLIIYMLFNNMGWVYLHHRSVNTVTFLMVLKVVISQLFTMGYCYGYVSLTEYIGLHDDAQAHTWVTDNTECFDDGTGWMV